MKTKRLETDVLIIGGGTAGCFAAYTLGKEAGVSVLIAEKATELSERICFYPCLSD